MAVFRLSAIVNETSTDPKLKNTWVKIGTANCAIIKGLLVKVDYANYTAWLQGSFLAIPTTRYW
ncbi:hypothetical protein CSQ88_19020 [Iodobacter sp. BJB302]|nr:hypothetical protein CSQ88_19020 [Iodobacter sp. BJB302]